MSDFSSKERDHSQSLNGDRTIQPSGSWDRFSSWVYGFCVVTFDLELGQAIERIYPPGIHLTERDKMNVCYLAFPDSNSGVMGDSQFHFRIRTEEGKRHKNDQESDGCIGVLPDQISHLSDYNHRAPAGIQFDPNYLFGFVYFRQMKDPNIRRGYYQKSLILLSRIPLISLFSHVTNVLAQKYFDSGGDQVPLEVACHDIDSWPYPSPGKSHELSFMGYVFNTFLPSSTTRSTESGTETVSVSSGSDSLIAPSPSFLVPSDLFTVISPVLEHVDTLWELILTGEPLVIMAGTPSLTSSAVQYLTTIIHPLAYCADYRPFYTIHDSDFKDITGSNCNALPNILLGVTNPFFSKALNHWPHIVKLGDGFHSAASSSRPSPRHSHHKQKKMSKFKLDSKPGLYSQSKPLLEKDRGVIKGIQKGLQLKRPVEVQSALLRRHFLELTQTFMIPLERYMGSLMPLAKNISPYRAAPKVKPFNPDDFFRSLEKCGPQLTSSVKGDWEGLYRRFFRSPNFVGWYHLRNKEVARKLELLQLESLSESKIEHWVRGKEEVQLVDMVLRIRKKLGDKSLELPDIVRERLDLHVQAIIKALPADLKQVLIDKSET